MNANCANTPKNVFFPTGNTRGGDHSRYHHLVAQAQAICEGCPQQLACLKLAIDNRETEGIWGGVNFRGRPSSRCGTEAAYQTHRRQGTDPCAPCTAAMTAANRRRVRARQERQA